MEASSNGGLIATIVVLVLCGVIVTCICCYRRNSTEEVVVVHDTQYPTTANKLASEPDEVRNSVIQGVPMYPDTNKVNYAEPPAYYGTNQPPPNYLPPPPGYQYPPMGPAQPYGQPVVGLAPMSQELMQQEF